MSCPRNTSAFGNRCIPSCPASGGIARWSSPAFAPPDRLNIGQWICALLSPCRMGTSAPSVRQPTSGTEHQGANYETASGCIGESRDAGGILC